MDGGREPCGAPNRLMASKHEQRLQGNTARESVADGSHTASMMRPRTVPTGFIPPWLPTKHPLPRQQVSCSFDSYRHKRDG